MGTCFFDILIITFLTKGSRIAVSHKVDMGSIKMFRAGSPLRRLALRCKSPVSGSILFSMENVLDV